jgi:hypothetical protein
MTELTNSAEPVLGPSPTSTTGAPGSRDYFRQLAAGRHPSVQHLVRQFAWAHLPEPLARVSAPYGELVATLLDRLTDDGPELTVALRKLRESKDCAVLAMVDQLGA